MDTQFQNTIDICVAKKTENGKMRKKRNKRNSDRNGGIRTKIQDYSAKIRMVGVYAEVFQKSNKPTLHHQKHSTG